MALRKLDHRHPLHIVELFLGDAFRQGCGVMHGNVEQGAGRNLQAGVFLVAGPGGMTAEFDISTTPAPSFVSIEGGGRERYIALRVEPPQ